MEKKSINHHMTYEVQLHTHHQKGQWHHSNANTALSHHHQQLSMYPLCTRFQTFSLFPLAHKQNTTLPLHSTNHSEMLMLLQPTCSIQGFPHWEQHLSGGANLRTSKKNYIGETKVPKANGYPSLGSYCWITADVVCATRAAAPCWQEKEHKETDCPQEQIQEPLQQQQLCLLTQVYFQGVSRWTTWKWQAANIWSLLNTGG